MDFLDIPRTLAGVHTFNQTLPRACFVSTDDFKIAAELDRNKLSLQKVEFGKRNVRQHLSLCGHTFYLDVTRLFFFMIQSFLVV